MKSIVIVGGGSAGWMSAAYLNKVLSDLTPQTTITLVESPEINTIGVGEATIPPIRDFFSLVGISEIELLLETEATIKSGIRFDNWLTNQDERYFHPFEAPILSDGINIASHWAAEACKGNPQRNFAVSTGLLEALSGQLKCSKQFDSADYDAPTAYAYHLDATLLGQLLKRHSINRGVTCIEDTVTSVNVADDGNITSLITNNHGTVEGDFFIDCTGFSAVLIERTLGGEFVSYTDELLCDSAVAMRTARTASDTLPPYTIASAVDAGWIWRIELANRNGNGYVFSSDHQAADAAELTLRQHLSADDSDEAMHLKMRVGRRREFWSKNCLAIGLSGGFIEPLESTGLQLIEMGLRMFFDHLPGDADPAPLRDKYNSLMRQNYDEIKDFIVLHYHLTQREDTPFWRANKHEVKPSDSLLERLERWQHKLPSPSDFGPQPVFGHVNYSYILAGMDRLVPTHSNLLKRIDTKKSQALMQEMEEIQQRALGASPLHSDYITRMRAPFIG